MMKVLSAFKGICYFKKGDLVNAVLNFQNTIDLNNNDIYAHFYIGNIYKTMGDSEAAADEFIKVIELSPDYSWAYYNLAVIDYENGNIQDALEKLTKTLELNPKDEEAYKIYAQIMAQQGMFQEAKFVLNMAFNNGVVTGNLFFILYQLDKNLGDLEACKTDLKNALENEKTLSVPRKTIEKALSELN